MEEGKVNVYFVGIHNKPGFKPLDSLTKSGKLIDRVIGYLRSDEDFNLIKCNLFDLEYLPDDFLNTEYVEQWSKRVNLNNYIVVGLGAQVSKILRKAGVSAIMVGHPGAVRSKSATDEYVADITRRVISEKAKAVLQ